MDYMNCCRTCLSSEMEMIPIQSCVRFASEEVNVTDILQDFYNFKVDPDLEFPENICINCIQKLTATYSFKALIDSSTKTLTDNLSLLDSTNENYESDEYYDQEPECHINIKKSKINKIKQSFEDENQLLFCVECKAEFHSVKLLNEHCTKNHHTKSEIGRDCEYCNEKFLDFRSLILHKKLHLKPYLCENCWEGFYNQDELNNHCCQPNGENKKKNKSEKLLRQCEQCGKSYPRGYFKFHKLIHSDDLSYSCKFCPKKFKVPGSLHSHILWNHKRTRNYECEVCNETFISSSSRSAHIRKHHLKERKYGCDSCEKRFFSKGQLDKHNLSHTGVKNFQCIHCPKSYQTRYRLNLHLKSHDE